MSSDLMTQEGWVVPRPIAAPSAEPDDTTREMQFVCNAGPYELDIVVRQSGLGAIEIAGQLTHADQLFDPASEVQVHLLYSGRIRSADWTATDEVGEFDFVTDRIERCGLRIGDSDDAPCVLVWEGDGS